MNGIGSAFNSFLNLYERGYIFPGMVSLAKPELDGYNGTGVAGDSVLFRYITDDREAKAYVDHSQTGTIGGENKGFNPEGGSVTDFVDEVKSFNFGNDHGPAWDLGIQDVNGFYNVLLRKLRIPRTQ